MTTTARKRKENIFRVNTSAMNFSISAINGISNSLPPVPHFWMTPEVNDQIDFIVERCDKEVGWFGLIRFHEEYNAYEMYKVILPEQKVTATETEIDGQAWAVAATELIQNGYDVSHMCAWFHSHVNMAVSPSMQDEEQVEEFLETQIESPEMPVFIRGIINKSGDCKVDIYYLQEGVAYTCIPVFINDARKDRHTEGLADLIDANVKPKYKTYNSGNVYQPPARTTQKQRNNGGGNSGKKRDQPNNNAKSKVADINGNDWNWEEEVEEWREELGLTPGSSDTPLIYGIDWDETTPVSERPPNWEDDDDYLVSGLCRDYFVH